MNQNIDVSDDWSRDSVQTEGPATRTTFIHTDMDVTFEVVEYWNGGDMKHNLSMLTMDGDQEVCIWNETGVDEQTAQSLIHFNVEDTDWIGREVRNLT